MEVGEDEEDQEYQEDQEDEEEDGAVKQLKLAADLGCFAMMMMMRI